LQSRQNDQDSSMKLSVRLYMTRQVFQGINVLRLILSLRGKKARK
jgi:hypothetical protein